MRYRRPNLTSENEGRVGLGEIFSPFQFQTVGKMRERILFGVGTRSSGNEGRYGPKIGSNFGQILNGLQNFGVAGQNFLGIKFKPPRYLTDDPTPKKFWGGFEFWGMTYIAKNLVVRILNHLSSKAGP